MESQPNQELSIETARIIAETEKAIAEKKKIELEIASIQKGSNQKKDDNAFVDLTKTITNIGSSIAGVTVIIGVLGFLSEIAHNRKLGLPTDISNPLNYIITGGRFILNTVDIAIQNGLDFHIILPLLITFLVFKSIKLTERRWRFAMLFETILLSIICLFVMWVISQGFGAKGWTSEFMTSGIEKSEINIWLTTDDYYSIWKYYAPIAWSLIAIILIFFYWYWKEKSAVGFFTHNSILKAIAIILMVVAVMGLSVAHGALLEPYAYPIISEFGVKDKHYNPFPLSQDATIDSTETSFLPDSLYLIKTTEKELICYDKKSFEVVHLNTDILSYYKLSRKENIFFGRLGVKDLKEHKTPLFFDFEKTNNK